MVLQHLKPSSQKAGYGHELSLSEVEEAHVADVERFLNSLLPLKFVVRADSSDNGITYLVHDGLHSILAPQAGALPRPRYHCVVRARVGASRSRHRGRHPERSRLTGSGKRARFHNRRACTKRRYRHCPAPWFIAVCDCSRRASIHSLGSDRQIPHAALTARPWLERCRIISAVIPGNRCYHHEFRLHHTAFTEEHTYSDVHHFFCVR